MWAKKQARKSVMGCAALIGMCVPFAAGTSHAALIEPVPLNAVQRAQIANAGEGFRSGALVFRPVIGVGMTYDDNIYADQRRESDLITTVRGGLNVATDFDLHGLYAHIGGAMGYYAKHSNENFQEYKLGAGGRLDLDYATYLQWDSAFQQKFEDRNAPNDPNADEPVEYTLSTHGLKFTRALGIIKLYVDGLYSGFRFSDSQRGNLRIDNSGRDRDIYEGSVKVAYEYLAGRTVYVGAKIDRRAYRRQTGAFSRDSSGTEIRIGADLYSEGKLEIDGYGGYLQRDYEGGQESTDAFSYGARAVWNATEITAFSLTIDRGIEETTYTDSSGDLQTRVQVGVDHAIDDNLYLGLQGNYTRSDYESRVADFSEDSFGGGASLTYMPYRGTEISAGYSYRQRESERAGEDYKSNRVTLNLTKQF